MSPKRQLMSMDRKTFKRLMGPMVDILRREVRSRWFLMQIPRVTRWAFDRSVFSSDQRPFWDDLKDRRHKGIVICFFPASGSFSMFLFWLCTKRQAVRYDATRQSSSGVWEVFEFCVGNSCRCRVQMCLSAQHHSFTWTLWPHGLSLARKRHMKSASIAPHGTACFTSYMSCIYLLLFVYMFFAFYPKLIADPCVPLFKGS